MLVEVLFRIKHSKNAKDLCKTDSTFDETLVRLSLSAGGARVLRFYKKRSKFRHNKLEKINGESLTLRVM